MDGNPFVAKNGEQILFRISLIMTVYFEGAHLKEKRRASVDILNRFVEKAGTRLKWSGDALSGRWMNFIPEVAATIGKQLEEAADSSAWEYCLHGGDTAEEPSGLEIKALGVPAWNVQNLSFLSIRLPVPETDDHGELLKQFVEMFESACRGLRPLHGYGGFGFAVSPDISARRASEFMVYKAAQRLLGVEVDYPVVHSRHLKNGIKGSNWLTALSEPFLGNLGGKSGLVDILGEGFLIKDYPGGITIQAGHSPDLGLDHAPVLYKRLAQALMPVRVKEHSSFQSGQKSAEYFDENASKAWLSRFD
jgi:hypothetical protein